MFDFGTTVEACLRRHRVGRGAEEASQKLTTVLEHVVSASLKTEEGTYPSFSLAFDLNAEAGNRGVLSWSRAMTFDPSITIAGGDDLAKVSTLSTLGKSPLVGMVDGSKIELVGIGIPPPRYRTPLGDWGGNIARVSVFGPLHFVVESGACELGYFRDGTQSSKYANVFDLDSKLSTEMLGTTATENGLDGYVLNRLLAEMWLAARGGILAITNEEAPSMETSQRIASGSLISMHEAAYERLQSEITANDKGDEKSAYGLSSEVASAERAAEEAIASVVKMSMVDGAVLLNRRLKALAFGAKLIAHGMHAHTVQAVEQSGETKTLDMNWRGTRHRSALSWVCEQDGRTAFVVSQDRTCTAIYWKDGGVRVLMFRPRLF